MCEERRRRRRRRRRREEKFIHVYILLFRHAPINCNTNPMLNAVRMLVPSFVSTVDTQISFPSPM